MGCGGGVRERSFRYLFSMQVENKAAMYVVLINRHVVGQQARNT
jgi:hypothetical protein